MFWKKKKPQTEPVVNPFATDEFVNVLNYISNDRMISTHDFSGKFTYVNDYVTTLLGYEPGELIGEDPFQYHHPDDVPALQENLDWVLKGEDINQQTYEFRHKDGHWVEVTSLSWTTPEEIIVVTSSSDSVISGEDTMAQIITTIKHK